MNSFTPLLFNHFVSFVGSDLVAVLVAADHHKRLEMETARKFNKVSITTAPLQWI